MCVCGAEDCESRDRQWLWKLLLEPISLWSISAQSTHRKVKTERKELGVDLIGGKFKSGVLFSSAPSQSDGVSGSDSEGSCSRPNTAVHSALPAVQPQLCGAAVELWVESTTKEPPVRLRGE